MLLSETAADPDLVWALHEGGAAGYVEKDIDPRRLPRVLDAVIAGEAIVPRRHVGQLLAELRDAAPTSVKL